MWKQVWCLKKNRCSDNIPFLYSLNDMYFRVEAVLTVCHTVGLRVLSVGFLFCFWTRWAYAIRGILEVNVCPRLRMWSWKHVREHRQKMKQYKELYKKKITSKKPPGELLSLLEVSILKNYWVFLVLPNYLF